jgi:hypothetical protein
VFALRIASAALFVATLCLLGTCAGNAFAESGCTDVYETAGRGGADIRHITDLSTPAAVRDDTKPLGLIRRLLAHSHVVTWVRAAAGKIFATDREPRDPSDCDSPARSGVANRSVDRGVSSRLVPFPRQRPIRVVTAQFQSVFAATTESPGTKNVARELAIRMERESLNNLSPSR